METTEQTNETGPVKRPGFLTVLCILTFISSGWGLLSHLFIPLFPDAIMDFFQQNPNVDEAQMAEMTKAVYAGWAYYAPAFLLILISLVGAVLMWNLKKIGFHLYVASNLALLFLPMLVVSIPIGMFPIVITLAFITMYAFNLKYMS